MPVAAGDGHGRTEERATSFGDPGHGQQYLTMLIRSVCSGAMASEIEPFYEELGKLIQGFRKGANMTQADLGSRMRPTVTRANVANIESAKQRVLAHMLFDIAGVLGVSISELFPKVGARTDVSRSVEDEFAKKLSIGKARARNILGAARLRRRK
jgi:transcriptional regulator with XRE-family HTH domain